MSKNRPRHSADISRGRILNSGQENRNVVTACNVGVIAM